MALLRNIVFWYVRFLQVYHENLKLLCVVHDGLYKIRCAHT